MDAQRYAHQMSIPGWDQERLAGSRVVLVGDDLLGGFIAWGLAALGVGEPIVVQGGVCDGRTSFPCLEPMPGAPAARALGATMRQLNPLVQACAVGLRLPWRSGRMTRDELVGPVAAVLARAKPHAPPADAD